MRSTVFFFTLILNLVTLAENPKHRKGFVPVPQDMKTVTPPKAKEPPPGMKRPLAPAKKDDAFRSSTAATSATAVGTGAAAKAETAPDRPKPGGCLNRPPIETYMQISSVYQPRPSPKGGLFFVSDLRETLQLFYTKSPNHWPEQVSFFADGVAYYELSPDGTKVLAATHQGGNEQYDIHLIEPGKKSVTPLVVNPKKRVESVVWAPSGKWFAYTSNERNGIDMDLYKYDIASLKATKLVDLKGSNRASDISPDEKWIALENVQSATDSNILIFSMADSKIDVPSQHSGVQNHEFPRFTKDSRGMFLVTDATRGTRELFLHRFGEKYPGTLLTHETAEIERVFLDDARDRLGIIVNQDGYGVLKQANVAPRGAVVTKLAEITTEKGVIGGSRFGHGKSVFYTHSNSRRTWDAWESKGGKPILWTKSTDGNLDPDCFIREELVSYPSFDGRAIPAFVYRPSGDTREIPFIVYVHGGPEAQYRPVFNKTFQYFLQNGFGILATNVRGSTGYGREFTMADDYKKRMDSVQDAVSGAKWLLEKRYATAGKLAVYGGSYGGFMVLRMIQVEPQLFAAASESVGISDFVSFLKNTKPYRRAQREAEYGPLSDEEFLKSISPMTYLDQIKTPLLIFHGANDPRVPVGESEQIAAALKGKDVPVELKVFADEGHGNTKLHNILEQARMMTRFFESNLQKKKEGP